MPPSKKKPRAQVTALLRLVALAKMLRTGQPFNSTTAAEDCGKCSRTTKRDIAVLRSLGWVIEWRKEEMSYTLKEAPAPLML